MIAALCAGIAQADKEFEGLFHGGVSIRKRGDATGGMQACRGHANIGVLLETVTMTRTFLLTGLLAAMPLHAEVLTLPGGPVPEQPAEMAPDYQHLPVDRSHLPSTGSSKSAVLNAYGEPVSMSGPVGDPPISRWVYGDFIVFFEYDHVINAVIPGKPREIYNREQLRAGDPTY